MDCREVEKLISLYIDKEVARQDRQELEEHVGSCRRCDSLLEEAMEIKDLVRRIEMKKAPAALVERIHADISSKSSSLIFVNILRLGTATAVFALAVYGGYSWFHQVSREPGADARATPVEVAAAPAPEGKSHAIPVQLRSKTHLKQFSSPAVSRFRKRIITPQVMENLVVEHVRPLPAEIQTPDLETVARWYASKSGFYAPPPQLASWGAKMEGGRMSRFQDREAVQLFYNVNGRRVTVFMFRPDMIPDIVDIPSVESLDQIDEEDYISTTPGGRMVALFSHNGIGYSIITDLDFVVMRQCIRSIAAQPF